MKKIKDVIDNQHIQRFFEQLNIETVEQCDFQDEDWEMLEHILKADVLAEIRIVILGQTENIPIEKLGLSVRSEKALLNRGFKTIKDLIESVLKVNNGELCKHEAFMYARGLGEKSLQEVYEKCELHGIILPTLKSKNGKK